MPKEGHFSHIAGKIALIYLVVCTLWILLSDRVIIWMEIDSFNITQLQSIKGLAFVLFTTVLIYLLVKRHEDATHEALERLRRSEKEKITVLDNITEQVLFFDPSFKIRWANKPVRDKFHFSEDDIKGYPMKEIWNLLQIEHSFQSHNHLSDLNEQSYTEVDSFNTASYLINDNPVHSKEGTFLGMIEVIIDITEIRRMQLEREELLRKVREQNVELEGITKQLFHEVQTPLVTLGNYSEYLAEALENEQKPEVIRSLQAIRNATISLEKRIQTYAARLRHRK
ncbi:MAG TPA: hypothetical protein ENN11_05975 [Methanomicrobia archaeon]|nr:hypothetical protein [Methanomicrobia archaeon]